MRRYPILIAGLVFGAALLLAGLGAFGPIAGFAGAPPVGVPTTALSPGRGEFSLPVSSVGGMAPGAWYDGACTGVTNAAASATRMGYTFRVAWGSPWESAAGFYDLLNVRVRADTHAASGDAHGWPVVYEGRLADLLVGPGTPGAPGACRLDPGDAHYYFFQFELSDVAGNAYQGARAGCTLAFEATPLAGLRDSAMTPGGSPRTPLSEPALCLLPVTVSVAPQGR